jgi:phage terminase large subunit-like protein
VIGVDVGGERSASAVVWLNERLHVGCAIFEGESGVLECVELMHELAAKYTVSEVVYDPWRFGQAAQELKDRVNVTQFPQSMSRMIPESQRLHEAITSQRLTLPDDPELARHAANAIARHSQRGWRIDKPTKETNIDAIVALCMALDAFDQRPEPVRLLGWL